MCRDRAAERPQNFVYKHRSLGPLRSPIATQGRSYSYRVCVQALAVFGSIPIRKNPVRFA